MEGLTSRETQGGDIFNIRVAKTGKQQVLHVENSSQFKLNVSVRVSKPRLLEADESICRRFAIGELLCESY